jgi:hypothetical protein
LARDRRLKGIIEMPTYTELLATRKSSLASATATENAAVEAALQAQTNAISTGIAARRTAEVTFDAALVSNIAACVTAQRSTLVPLFTAYLDAAADTVDFTAVPTAAVAFASACVTADDTARAQTSAGMGLRAIAAAAEAIIAADAQAAPGIVGALIDHHERAFQLKAANATATQSFRNAAPVLVVDACRLLESELRIAGQLNRGTLGAAVSARWSAWLAEVHT